MTRGAAIQLNSTGDAERNRTTAERLIREAADRGATVVVLPEKWNRLCEAEPMAAGAETLDGPSTTWARQLSVDLGIDLIAGSIVEGGGEAKHNTSVHAGPDGRIHAAYRKLHLFDVEVAGTVYRESAHERPGDEVVVSELADGAGLGMSICYDLRFPELYRALSARGVRVIVVPSAFTLATTRDHWEALLRARAIENQAFVIAANQVGEHAPGLRSGGRSMIVDPWGVVLAQAPDAETAIVADLDYDRQDEIRHKLPALEHRRDEVFEGVRT